MQRLLRRADWNIDGARDDVRDYVVERLGDRAGVLIVDDTGCFQQAKNEAGLDEYQARTYRAWYAHATLSMLALAWLSGTKSAAVKWESETPTTA